jgi:hypothetical protein
MTNIAPRKHVGAFATAVAVTMVCGESLSQSNNDIPDKPEQMTLWKEIDIAAYSGTFPCLGDLDNDGKVDFLLYRQGPQTTPVYLVAVDHNGKKLWSLGDPAIAKHMPDGDYREPALRGIAFVYDLDADGRSEVVTEFWKDGEPMLYALDGATGKIEHARQSPFNLNVRGGKRSRCHPALAELGSHEEYVRQRLHGGISKSHVATQAFAVDLCGAERDELVLYQPYNGEAILIFTQPDSDGREKRYVHQESVYNIHSYF